MQKRPCGPCLLCSGVFAVTDPYGWHGAPTVCFWMGFLEAARHLKHCCKMTYIDFSGYSLFLVGKTQLGIHE